MSEPIPQTPPAQTGRGGAVLVAAGILSSRVVGLLRARALGHFFGVGAYVDVLNMALRAPNFLQNLLGEGTLSATFIPGYSRLIHAGRHEDAGRFAGAVFGLLAALAGTLALLGVIFARPITSVLALGFRNDVGGVDRFELTVQAVRIIFPMTAFLVLSAWALGVLNSHRRFFLPYFAPVLWNVAIVTALIVASGTEEDLLFAACWGALAGGLLQFLVQLPAVARLLPGFRLSLSTRAPGVREALAAVGPVVAGRGVVQLAGYLDLFLAGFLVSGAISALSYAQTLYLLPVSLFGMSVAAAELPELSRLSRGGDPAAGADLLARVRRSLRQTAFLNVPTFAGYLAFGYLVVGLLYRTGKFGREDNWLVYLVLCGYTLGLLASTSSRLLQNTFFALGDTRSPARIATFRVAASAGLGVPLMLVLDRWLVSGLTGGEGKLTLGAVGLALASGVGAWLEFVLLSRALGGRLPGAFFPGREIGRMLLAAAAAGLPAALLWWLLPTLPFILTALLVVGCFAGAYLVLARIVLPEDLGFWLGRFGRRLGRRSG